MYGLGGSFGGMPYQSPAGAAADGIVAGWNMVRQSQQQDRLNDRQDRLDAQNSAHMAFMERNEADAGRRADFKQAWDIHNQQRQDIGGQMQGILADNGGDPQKAAADPRFAPLQDQIQQWNGVHNSLMKSVYSGVHAQGLDDAKATTAKMNAGNFDPTSPDNAEELAHWSSVMFRQDPSNLLNWKIANADPAAATKSMFSDAAQDLHQGLTQGDPKQTASGFQALYGPQIEAGRLGYLDPMGGQITSATINPDKPFVPTPDGKKAMPVMSVTGQLPDGSTTQQPYAPPTQGGFHHDDNQDLHALDPAKTFDYLGTQGAMHSIIQHPLVQNNLADYMQNPSDKVKDWAASFTALGAGDGMVTHLENDGGRLLAVTYSKDGRTVKSAEVPNSMPTTEYGAREKALEDEVAAGRMTPQEANQARITGIVKPGGGSGIAGQKMAIALDLLNGELHDGKITQDQYDEQMKQFVGILGKGNSGSGLAAAKLKGSDAEEQAHLDAGEIKDPILGWTKATKPDQLESLRVARQAFNAKAAAHNGAAQPGIADPRVHDVPGTVSPDSQNPQTVDPDYVTRAMSANPGMTRAQVEAEARKLGKFTKKPAPAAGQ